MTGHWMNEWELGAADWGQAFRAKRSKRRPARGEVGGEDYLVSVCDTSAAARRKLSRYLFPIPLDMSELRGVES